MCANCEKNSTQKCKGSYFTCSQVFEISFVNMAKINFSLSKVHSFYCSNKNCVFPSSRNFCARSYVFILRQNYQSCFFFLELSLFNFLNILALDLFNFGFLLCNIFPAFFFSPGTGELLDKSTADVSIFSIALFFSFYFHVCVFSCRFSFLIVIRVFQVVKK